MTELLTLPRAAWRIGVTAKWLRAEADAGRVQRHGAPTPKWLVPDATAALEWLACNPDLPADTTPPPAAVVADGGTPRTIFDDDNTDPT